MKESAHHQTEQQLRARLLQALNIGDPTSASTHRSVPDQPPARRAAPGQREIDESVIRTVLRSPEDPPAAPNALPPTESARTLLARWPFTTRHLVVVAVIAAAAVLCAGWFLLQARAVPLPATARPSGPALSSPSVQLSPGSQETPVATTIKVHVLGAVRKPQVVTVPESARVKDAIDAAGGLAKDARLGQLNLAQPVRDGQQIFVASKDGKSSAGEDSEVRDPGAGSGPGSGSGGSQQDSSGSGTAPGAATGKLDLNAATVAELEQLPGVGPVTAASIIGWREQHGKFTRVEELQEIDGIGPKTFARLAPLVRV